MRSMRTHLLFAVCSCLLSVSAATASEFYERKNITIAVGNEAGTGYDIYARVLARHMGNHVPGRPSFTVQNMPGAGGLTVTNWLYNIASKDGTVIATFSQTAALEPTMGNAQARFDASKFNWIGNMDASIGLCSVTGSSKAVSFSDVMGRDNINFGATGAEGPLAKLATAVKNLLGAPITVIAGYKGTVDVKMAMERDEVQGICGPPWTTVKSLWGPELASGEFRPVLQLSGSRTPDMPVVPHVKDFAKTDADRALFDLVFGLQVLGRIYAAPPGVPAERVSDLRKAFNETMLDDSFLDEAKKLSIDINASTGEEVAEKWAQFAAAPRALIDAANKATRR